MLKRNIPDVSENGAGQSAGRYSAVVRLFLSVIPELEGDAEVVAAEQTDDILQLVL